MSLKYLLLGALMERSFHGYDLKASIFKKTFADFGINDGQLYPMLKKLEQENLIDKAVQHREGAPSRHVYTLTEMGRREFMQWLADDDGEEISFRYDFFRKDIFFIRCNYMRYLDKETAVAKVRRQIATVEDTIADLNQARENMIRKEVDPLRVSILEYGIRSQEARGQWLKDFLNTIETVM